ncbi:MAG: 2OG-Fe(II) oxygenase [Chitinophagales bacterium]|nr:2OG-Fe(II) oxygenase [Chitinophagales bacterium]
MSTQKGKTIIGDDRFYDIIELDYQDAIQQGDIISKIHAWDIQGAVIKNVLSESEVNEVIQNMAKIPTEAILHTDTGTSFPDPFATITNGGERLDNYINKKNILYSLPFTNLLEKIDAFFSSIETKIKSEVPELKTRSTPAVPGNFRVLPEEKGGLFVHCGYLFQKKSPFYYEVVSDMVKEGQLSYFMVLQNADEGGELTLYDMLWKDIQDKDNFIENRYVLQPNGEKLYLKDVRQFYIKPNPGDIFIFSGGPIWHRVEPVKGQDRITFGGFVNFSADSKTCYYWS